MNKLPLATRKMILRCLVEGMSIRSTVRTTGASKNTILKLLIDAGKASHNYQDKALVNLTCRRIETDEIWSFIYAKDKNVRRALNAPPEAGDVWTWVAMDPNSKLIVSWRIGDRSGSTAIALFDDLRGRLANRVQLTSDGYRVYIDAIEGAFGGDVDYAQLVKVYGQTGEEEQRRYSPARCIGSRKRWIVGNPDPAEISTSHVERQNLTMRMSMRRFTRLTNAFSRKVENHAHAVALHFMHYNFCRMHGSLKATPAMAAGATDRQWEIEDIIRLIDERSPRPGPRGPYKARNSN